VQKIGYWKTFYDNNFRFFEDGNPANDNSFFHHLRLLSVVQQSEQESILSNFLLPKTDNDVVFTIKIYRFIVIALFSHVEKAKQQKLKNAEKKVS
jgi:hypothetical protein